MRTTLLVRARTWEDVAFQGELATIAQRAASTSATSWAGAAARRCPSIRSRPTWLERLVPDITSADVLVCGSQPYTERVLSSLRAIGVPAAQIHAERFGA